MELVSIEQNIDLNKTLTVELPLKEMIMLTAAIAKTSLLDREIKYKCWRLNTKDIEDPGNDANIIYGEMKEILKQNGIEFDKF